jgi:hypothetical protein
MDPPQFVAKRLALKLEPAIFYLEYTDDLPKTRVRVVCRMVLHHRRCCCARACVVEAAGALPGHASPVACLQRVPCRCA